MLEFALGMGIAWAWRRGLRLSWGRAYALALVALAWLAFDFDGIRFVPLDMAEPNGVWRLIGCGAPMAMLFAAAALVEPALPAEGRVARLSHDIGDASYSLYLFHPLAIIFVRKAYLLVHLDAWIGLWPLVGIEVAAAVAVALAIYRFVESPVTRALQLTPARTPVLAPEPGKPAPFGKRKAA